METQKENVEMDVIDGHIETIVSSYKKQTKKLSNGIIMETVYCSDVVSETAFFELIRVMKDNNLSFIGMGTKNDKIELLFMGVY